MNFRKIVDSMNVVQKAGAFIAVALLLIVIVLHGPWDGYAMTRYVDGMPEIGIRGSFVELSFLDWTTNSPVVAWFGSILHALIAIVVIVFGFYIWHYLFRSSKGNS